MHRFMDCVKNVLFLHTIVSSDMIYISRNARTYDDVALVAIDVNIVRALEETSFQM